jgi:plastocyanin
MHLISPRLTLSLFVLGALVVGCSGTPAATVGDSGDGGPCTVTTDAPAVTVTIAGSAFDPGTVQATVGQAIGWENQDALPHTATLDEGDCTTENLGRGDVGGLVFSVPGTYSYHCRIHPDMTGTIEITG